MSSGIYETQDILLAAFLLSRNRTMLETTPSQLPGRDIFVFADPNNLLASDAKEFLDDGPIPVRTLARNLSKLRNQVRQKRHGAQNTRNYVHRAVPGQS
jgi:hypothetical protein